MKFKYLPGLRPTPMLMYYNSPNKEVFNNQENSFIQGVYSDKMHHIWNIGAYIIYNNVLEVIAYNIIEPINFLWLLRIINQALIIDFAPNFIENNQKFLEETTKELILM